MTSSCSPFLDTILSEQWAMSMSLMRKTVCRRHGSWRWRGVGAEIVQSHPSRAPERRAHYSIQSQCTHLMINDDHHHVIIIIIIIGYPGCSFSSSLNSEMVGYMFSLLIIFCTLKFHLSLLAPYTLYLGALRKEYSMILCKYSYKFSIGYLLSIFILSCKLGKSGKTRCYDEQREKLW